jgi:alginate O-acetyltransferase complex protein AlgJ
MQNKGVKKLLLKLTLLVLPFLLWPLIEVFVLPINYFTFRVWETLVVNKMRILSGPFYPNMYVKMEEEGELAPRTPYAEKKVVEWYTDEWGYRNRDTKCDVLLIGDSNVTGVKLTQDETLSEVLEGMIGQDVYSFAPGTVNRFLATERLHKNPPKVVIVASIERRIPELTVVGSNGINSKLRNFTGEIIHDSPFLNFLTVSTDRITKLASYQYTLGNINRKFGNRSYYNYHNEFFLEGDYANRQFTAEEINYFADIIEEYKKVIEARGYKFMFLPIPNKENIYYEMLPSKQKPNMLPLLMAELNKRNIDYIDTQTPFKKLYQEKGVELYPVDDAHWNEVAVQTAAKLVAQRLLAKDQKEAKNEKYLVKYAE